MNKSIKNFMKFRKFLEQVKTNPLITRKWSDPAFVFFCYKALEIASFHQEAPKAVINRRVPFRIPKHV